MTNNTANDRLLTLLGCTLATWLSLIPTVSAKPNVVFILADDLGWSDTTLYGTTSFYKTPNIERLAARGMTFTRAYSDSPLCSPTRASILTGLSPARHGITTPNCHLPIVTLAATVTPSGPANQKATIPKPVTRLTTDYYTLAEMFKDNGYATGHFGKWHLGAEPYSPLEHGFDVDVPHHPGPGPAGSYVAPWKFKDFDHDPDVPDQHLEDRMAKEAVAFLQQYKDEPFFLNYWMFSVHAPFDAKRSLIDKYRKQVDPNDPQRSPTYAAMIESMDDAVGTLLDTLDRLGIADNTIIVFASDNGGNMYNEVDGTSATSNAPLRGGKATMYEGGVRGPAIVVYPGHVKAGSHSDARIQTSDYYPTLLDLLEIDAQPEQTFDGISITAALDGKSLDREAIFTYFPHSPRIPEWLPPAVSVHAGDWKLIRVFFGGDDGKHDYKLFNLRADIGERNNLAKEHPKRVRQLDAMIDEFLEDTRAVLPLPNPKFDPAKFDPDQIGKAALKGTGTNQKKPRRNAKPVAGWKPGGTCELTLEQGALIVTSVGGDPYLSFTMPDAVKEKSLILKFSLASQADGHGQIFWQEQGVAPPFSASRSKPFDVQHDGEAHEYSVSWTAHNPVVAIRIDPATAKGRVRLSNIRLTTDDGEEVYRWKF
ncbi:N-acetylgalactosamine 6-sulfate sulfatase (GALNS) [Rhodopirellula sp. SM50]|nr:sulfatase [Rhodopirellula sp. SM50]PAY19172.1 N-acetylgalactosamine 6-sulfate sulfatase (GALNS) [Rhodopirellula sp. SM50]